MIIKHSLNDLDKTDMLIKLLLKKSIISEEEIYQTKIDMASEVIANENRTNE